MKEQTIPIKLAANEVLTHLKKIKTLLIVNVVLMFLTIAVNFFNGLIASVFGIIAIAFNIFYLKQFNIELIRIEDKYFKENIENGKQTRI
jgi:hypothetical protein